MITMNKLKKCILPLIMIALAAAITGCSGGGDTAVATSVTNPNANPFTPKGTVSGVLRDSVSLQPIPNATVAILDKTATTDSRGMFTITNVPAATAVGNEVGNIAITDFYNVVIDLTNYNKSLAAGAVKYPDFAYAVVNIKYDSLGETSIAGNTSSTNHDTPVDGFVANIAPVVGKLDASFDIQVVDSNRQPVANVPVVLYSTGSTLIPGVPLATGAVTFDTGLGNPGRQIGLPKVSDKDGMVSFSDVEALRVFVATADNGGASGFMTVFAPSDGQKISFLNNKDKYNTGPSSKALEPVGAGLTAGITPNGVNDALQITNADAIVPTIIQTSPLNLADVPNKVGQTVTFTFSEDMAGAFNDTTYPYASATTAANSANGGIYRDVYVNYDGPKAGNLAYTVAWTDARTLAVTFDTLPASRYTVAILQPATGAGTGLLDRSTIANPVSNIRVGNPLAYPIPVVFAAVPAAAVVTFSTNGVATLGTPVVTVNAGSNPAPGAVSASWLQVAGAFSYNVYATPITNGVAGTTVKTNQLSSLPNTFTLLAAAFNAATTSYTLQVAAVSAMGVEGIKSTAVTLTWPALAAPAAVQTGYTLNWPAVPNANGYIVHITTFLNGTATGSVTVPLTAATLTYTIAPINGYGFLNGAQTYEATLGVVNFSGVETLQTTPAKFTFADAGLAAPANVTANPANFEIISWSAVPKAASYNVHVTRTNSFDGTTVTEVINQAGLTFNISTAASYIAVGGYGSDCRYSYTVQVGTLDAFAVETPKANWSPVVNFSSAAPAQVDASTVAVVSGTGSMAYTWTAIPGASAYEVQLQATIGGVPQGWVAAILVSGGAFPVAPAVVNDGTPSNFLSFAAGPPNFSFPPTQVKTYAFRIRAINAKGVVGSFSDATSANVQITELANSTTLLNANTFASAIDGNGYFTSLLWPAKTRPLFSLITIGSGANFNDLNNIDPIPSVTGWGSAVRTYGYTVNFTAPMSEAAVETLSNWSITKSTGTPAQLAVYGTYSANTAGKDLSVGAGLNVQISSVVFDNTTQTAYVQVTVNNASGNGTLDTKHIKFAYVGTDANGKPIVQPATFDKITIGGNTSATVANGGLRSE